MTLTAPAVFRRLSGTPDVTRLNRKKTALLLIGFQTEHFTGTLPAANADAAIRSAVRLKEWADKNKIPVFFIRHQAKSPASPVFAPDGDGTAFHPPLLPNGKDAVLTKYADSAFGGSGLHTALETAGADTLVIAGIPTPAAIAATAHDARLLGYRGIVATDATASCDVMSWDGARVVSAAVMQETALANIADRYAQVAVAADIAALPFER